MRKGFLHPNNFPSYNLVEKNKLTSLRLQKMGEVQHDNLLSEQIGSLYLNGNYSDVYLVVEGNHFAAHRAVLASRSAHFRYVTKLFALCTRY